MSSFTNRAVALFDGMNLYNHAKNAFGDRDGRYDPVKLARFVAESQGYDLVQTRFYVGVPPPGRHRRPYDYWQARLSAMEETGCWFSGVLSTTLEVEDKKRALTSELRSTQCNSSWTRFVTR